MVALFNSKQAADITKRIKEYETLQRKIEEPIAHDEEWTRQKKFFYPDEPVINLGEMDEKTMYPYCRPKKEKTGSLYDRGYRYCSRCQIYYKTTAKKCSNCDNWLRQRARTAKQDDLP